MTTRIFLYGGAAIIAGIAALFFAWRIIPPSETYKIPVYSATSRSAPKVRAEHLKTPTPVRAIYMTSCVAGTPSLRDRLLKFVKETEVNAVVVDLKDYTGAISFAPLNPDLASYAVSGCPIADFPGFVKSLHDEHIYIIGRVTTFQDPMFTKNNPSEAVKKNSDHSVLWPDKKGINYTDPGSKKAWEHIVAIARDAHDQGVDEINFDYIRFPSDGNMNDIYFPVSGDRSKPEVLESFFKYLHDELKPEGTVISADVFGMTTSVYIDVGIGQMWETLLPHFDYVAPMIYPSHYYGGFGPITNPNEHPYEVIHEALRMAILRTESATTSVKTLDGKVIASTTPQLYTKKSFPKSKIRPWLQDFDYPVPYTPAMVKAQIQATYDLGLDSWMMWDPSNTYTKEIYEREPAPGA